MTTGGLSPFGSLVRRLRDSRGWTLEVLGDRIHTDRANIHRIESGHGRPRYETVRRLVAALNATPSETVELFERAGYQAPMWPTTQQDFEALKHEMDAEWFGDAPPATLITDAFWTLWHVNGTFASLLTGSNPAQLVGLHYVALCLDPQYGFRSALGTYAPDDEVDAFLALVVCRLRRRIAANQGGIRSNEEFAHLTQLPGFMDLWERAGTRQHDDRDVLTGYIRVNLRNGGRLIVGSATATCDRRFLFIHYLPADERAVEAMRARFRRQSALPPSGSAP